MKARKLASILAVAVAVAMLAARAESAGAQQGSSMPSRGAANPLSCLQNTTASLAVACPDIVRGFPGSDFILYCSPTCAAAAGQLPRACVNEIVSVPLYGEAFQALFELCKRTYTDPGTNTGVGKLQGGNCLEEEHNRAAAKNASRTCSSFQVSPYPTGGGFSPNCSPDCTDALSEIPIECINEIAADSEVGFINRFLLRACGTRYSAALPTPSSEPPAPTSPAAANMSVFTCLNEAPNVEAGAQVQASCTDLLVASADGRFGIDCSLTCQNSLAQVSQDCIDQIAATSFYGQAFRLAFFFCKRGFTDGPGALVGRAMLRGDQCLQSNRNSRLADDISTSCANFTTDFVPQDDGSTGLGLNCPKSCGEAISKVDSDCLGEILQDEEYGAINEVLFQICNVNQAPGDAIPTIPGPPPPSNVPQLPGLFLPPDEGLAAEPAPDAPPPTDASAAADATVETQAPVPAPAPQNAMRHVPVNAKGGVLTMLLLAAAAALG